MREMAPHSMLMAATWPGTSSTFFRDNKDDEGEDDAAEEEEWCELSARSGAGNSAPVVVVVVVVVVAVAVVAAFTATTLLCAALAKLSIMTVSGRPCSSHTRAGGCAGRQRTCPAARTTARTATTPPR